MDFRWPWQKRNPAKKREADAGVYVEYYQGRGLVLSAFPKLSDEEIMAFLDSALTIVESNNFAEIGEETPVPLKGNKKGHLTLVKG